jgi:hypothetical protein
MPAFDFVQGGYTIDSSQADDGNPPGIPPGFNQVTGIYFRTEYGWDYQIDRQLTSAWEVDPSVFVYDNGLLGLGLIDRKWVRTGDIGNNDEVVVAGFHKAGPFNPGLPWNLSTVHTSLVDATNPNDNRFIVEFECGGGNYSIIIHAFKI